MEKSSWPDVLIAHWAFHDIEEASKEHYYECWRRTTEKVNKRHKLLLP